MMAYGEARHYFEESLELAMDNNYQWEMASALLSLGWLSLFLGDLDQAVNHLSRAAKATKDLGMLYRVPPSLANLGVTYWLAGDFNRAEDVIRESRQLTNELNPGVQLFPIICLAEFFTLMGRYPEAKDQLQILDTLTRDIFVERFTDGRLERVLGYIALSDKDYAGAAHHFEKSVEKFSIDTDDEQIAWSQSGWARALMGQGKWHEAQQLLTEALWTSIEIKGFIPMIFSLPIGVQLLAREDPELASHLYQKITSSPFISKAPYFEDITFKYLSSDIRQTTDHYKEHITDLNQDLWTTAARLLSNWIQVWMEEPENIEQKIQDK
jgi:tetratricopeptide (TPR) repeat protein